ncbi:hypothetical protein O9G_002567 [Rozella allomycis CSF55]|uniref:Uncharacterized protein n=1 Tax=Rozella allomycis (strain CSF55) TaxID=988480 RepID=A0A075AU23_ROZAC|nr:hypothetical protein O9G_002567 [Rozella allomycis CSF55]|eukprot:EPZ32215.1 hypothetical protein O9G_002567 [Rozella allomycis CSF55]
MIALKQTIENKRDAIKQLNANVDLVLKAVEGSNNVLKKWDDTFKIAKQINQTNSITKASEN